MRFILAILFCASVVSEAAEKSKLEEQLRAAVAAYRRGDHQGALKTLDIAVKDHPKSIAAWANRSHMNTALKRYPQAVADATAALKLDSDDAELYQMRGEAHFRNVQMEEAIKDFDEFIKRRPSREPHHWQRGIAHYYAGQYAKGRRQFTVHQTVNGNDVENAVFHFICTAKAIDVKTAQKEFISISGDSRIPMFQIHRLFAGNMTVEQVLEAAGRPSPDDILNRRPLTAAAKVRQEFYANYYIGLYYDSHGEAKKAGDYIFKAAKTADLNGYMGDCARVHAALIRRAEKKKTAAPKTEATTSK
ncbi:MAG: tetratricopeptide repeat protein [Limisphaerales bacterium]